MNDKSGGPKEFNSVGRAASNHQSPFNLKLTFAASGATMYVGFTVNDCAPHLADIWWRPGEGLQNKPEEERARAIFYDIAEAMHQQPNLGEKWRAAWRQAAKAPPTRRAAAADSSPSPATRHPASGGKGSSPPQPLAPRWISTSPPSLLWSLPDSKGPWGSSKRSFPDPNDSWVPSKKRRR